MTPSKQQHTAAPWSVEQPRARTGQRRIVAPTAQLVASVQMQGFGVAEDGNAERIVACVNACEGIDTDALGEFPGGKVAEILNAAQLAMETIRGLRATNEAAKVVTGNALAELASLRASNAALAEALRDMRQRFHAACIASGSDAWAADSACAKADAALSKVQP